MSLVSCPECNNKISSIATKCPYCGYPIMRKQSSKQFLNSLEKNKSKIIIIGIVVLVVIVLVILASVFVPKLVEKQKLYANSIELVEAGNPDDLDNAIANFKRLAGFRDSEKLLVNAQKAAKYYDAIAAYEKKSFLEAADLFRDLGDYEDSKKLAEQSIIDANDFENKYLQAIDEFDNRDFSAAKTQFETIQGYKETQKYLSQIEVATDTQIIIEKSKKSLELLLIAYAGDYNIIEYFDCKLVSYDEKTGLYECHASVKFSSSGSVYTWSIKEKGRFNSDGSTEVKETRFIH